MGAVVILLSRGLAAEIAGAVVVVTAAFPHLLLIEDTHGHVVREPVAVLHVRQLLLQFVQYAVVVRFLPSLRLIYARRLSCVAAAAFLSRFLLTVGILL